MSHSSANSILFGSLCLALLLPMPRVAAQSTAQPLAAVAPRVLGQAGPPAYPSGADGQPARALLELSLDATGRVTGVHVVELDRAGPARAVFEEAALRQASALRFVPAQRAGVPVPARVRYAMTFDPGVMAQAATPIHAPKGAPPGGRAEGRAAVSAAAKAPVALAPASDPAPPAQVPPVSPGGVVGEASGSPKAPEPAPSPAPDPSASEEPAAGPAGAQLDPSASVAPDGAPLDSDGLEFRVAAEAPRPFQATSSVDLEGAQLRLRPHRSAGDLLNAASGFYVIQHAGGGKANQYFLRGFDADHGTDVALFVDGIPQNHVSHGHGQGYTDLHWVIPELVERMEIRKGPYFAEYGDFATAGAVNLVLQEQATRSAFSLGGGTYRNFDATAVLSPQLDGLSTFVALEAQGSAGPFDKPDQLRRFNLMGRVARSWAPGASASLMLSSHLSHWNASGQIPLRAVRDGRVGRFGAIDRNEGGRTERHGLVANLKLPSGPSASLDTSAWLTRYRFALYSNFTFFSADPDRGDMIRQGDERLTGGLRTRYERQDALGALHSRTRAGVQLRFDDIDNTLHDAPGRELGQARIDAAVDQSSLGVFAEQELRYHWLRGVVGARIDQYQFAAQDRLQEGAVDGSPGSGEANALRVSPKATLVVTPVPELELFANFGFGFHSNDARGAVRRDDPVTPLTRARGYEAGLRTRPFAPLEFSIAAFALDLDSETVWVGDEGTTEARGATRRFGIEGEAHLDATSWLRFDFDATWTRSRFVDNPSNASAIALAPTLVLEGSANLQHAPSGLSGRLSLLYLADRPATEDEFLTAEGFYRVDLGARYQHERFALDLSIENLTNTAWRQAQFATTARLRGEDDADSCPAGSRPVEEDGAFAGCEDINFTPGWPFHLMLTGTAYF